MEGGWHWGLYGSAPTLLSSPQLPPHLAPSTPGKVWLPHTHTQEYRGYLLDPLPQSCPGIKELGRGSPGGQQEECTFGGPRGVRELDRGKGGPRTMFKEMRLWATG